MINLGSRVF